jgi:hypothetical protein
MYKNVKVKSENLTREFNVRRYVGVKRLTELDKYISDDILSLWENKKYTVRRYPFLIKKLKLC